MFKMFGMTRMYLMFKLRERHLHHDAEHDHEEDGDDSVADGPELSQDCPVLELLPDGARNHGEPPSHCDETEDHRRDLAAEAEQVRQVDIGERDHLVRIPVVPGHEEVPAGAAEEDADGDHPYPEDEEAEAEGCDGELALAEGVVTVSPRIDVDVGNDHQADDDERGQ